MHAHDLDAVPSLPRPRPATLPSQGTAIVVERDADDDGQWWLRRADDGDSDQARFGALRAASCMLEPEPGDRVWFAREGEAAFVLAILVRAAGDSPARLAVPGDLELDAGGQLRVHGRGGVELASPAGLGLRSDSLELTAREATLSFATVRATAKQVFATLARVTRVGKILELLVDTVTQRSRSSYRAIAEVDHVQAKLINHEASADLHLHGQRALINGEDIVKVDGGQIHLG